MRGGCFQEEGVVTQWKVRQRPTGLDNMEVGNKEGGNTGAGGEEARRGGGGGRECGELLEAHLSIGQ